MKRSVTREVGWHEDPERPGVLVPDEPIVVRHGESFTITTTEIIDQHGHPTVLPWAEGTVTTFADEG